MFGKDCGEEFTDICLTLLQASTAAILPIELQLPISSQVEPNLTLGFTVKCPMMWNSNNCCCHTIILLCAEWVCGGGQGKGITSDVMRVS